MSELLRRWVEGWRLCRGLAPVIEYDDAVAVVLRLPGRERELFALTDDPLVVDRLAAGMVEDVWLTVTTQHGAGVARRLAAAGLEPFAEQKLLMSIDLRDHPQPATSLSEVQVWPSGDEPYELEITSAGPLEYVRILAVDGTIAARGMASIVDNDAVMHDIQTDPAHRRRGLGSVVMGALSRRAVERGADSGLLMATVEGVHLYRTLGWLPEATMVTARGSGGSGAVSGDLGAVLTGR
ncbi:GNAT family N-acetyltransferase [Kribbella sp. NPDC049174]|uniref:GNAT family N-acetyltransferase n=1 Tax=Kribbella sp. NPDC049174 TaxID=3364112 RepID=UPI00371779FA